MFARAALAGLLAGCSFSGPGGSSGNPAADGGTADAPGVADASADAGGDSGLVDRGLVARYFIDEASSGTGDDAILDSAADPVDLSIDSTDGDLSFTEVGGHRGLVWAQDNTTDGVFLADISGTKFPARLDTKTAATIEVVVDAVALDTNGARLVHLGASNGNGRLVMRTRGGAGGSSGDPAHWWNGTIHNTWGIDLEAAGRVVLHLVIDTTLAQGRAQFLVDGVAQTPSGAEVPQNEALSMVGQSIGIGNRLAGDRASQMTIYYVAIYDVALTASEIDSNVERLRLSDDRQP